MEHKMEIVDVCVDNTGAEIIVLDKESSVLGNYLYTHMFGKAYGFDGERKVFANKIYFSDKSYYYNLAYYRIDDYLFICDEDCEIDVKDIKKAVIKAKLGGRIEKFECDNYIFHRVIDMAFTDYTVFFVYKKEYPKISKDNRYLVNAMRKFQFSGEFLGFPLDVKEQENLGKDFVTSVTFYDGNWRTIISALENVLIKSGHKQGNTRILAVYNTKDDLHILVQYNNVFKDTIIGVQNGDLCVSSEEDIEHENVYKILRKQKHINYVRKDIIKEMRSFRNQVKLRK